MPGRYISDTAKHCVTVNTTIMAPRPFNVRATLGQAQGMAYRYEGDPPPPRVNQLPLAEAFEYEKLYVFHYAAAEEHPDGRVVPTDIEENDIAYRVDLTGEPSGVTAYFNLHADTTQADQDFYFGTELADEAELQMRVRQYNNGSNDATYYDAVEWTNITTSGQQHFSLHVDKSAARNSGRAVLEFKFTTHSSTFPNGTRVAILTPIATRYTLQPVNSVATICDEKDNYRFGFNGQEKDNEAKGLGTHLTLERGYMIAGWVGS